MGWTDLPNTSGTTQVITKTLLSGSTNGKGILVVATATPGTTIHTAVAGTSSYDEIWLYATNTSASAVVLNIEWGEAGSSPSTNTVITIPAKAGRFLVCDGRLLQNGLVVTAFAGTTNVIVVDGFVNNYT